VQAELADDNEGLCSLEAGRVQTPQLKTSWYGTNVTGPRMESVDAVNWRALVETVLINR
jgi:hypothetical protein